VGINGVDLTVEANGERAAGLGFAGCRLASAAGGRGSGGRGARTDQDDKQGQPGHDPFYTVHTFLSCCFESVFDFLSAALLLRKVVKLLNYRGHSRL
jgi:hypothetical protein